MPRWSRKYAEKPGVNAGEPGYMSAAEVVRRTKRFFELPIEERPISLMGMTILAGVHRFSLQQLSRRQHAFEPTRAKLERVYRLIESGKVSATSKDYVGTTITYHPDGKPPQKHYRAISFTKDGPRIQTHYYNPNALPPAPGSDIKPDHGRHERVAVPRAQPRIHKR